jgi:hypothetical protein
MISSLSSDELVKDMGGYLGGNTSMVFASSLRCLFSHDKTGNMEGKITQFLAGFYFLLRLELSKDEIGLGNKFFLAWLNFFQWHILHFATNVAFQTSEGKNLS